MNNETAQEIAYHLKSLAESARIIAAALSAGLSGPAAVSEWDWRFNRERRSAVEDSVPAAVFDGVVPASVSEAPVPAASPVPAADAPAPTPEPPAETKISLDDLRKTLKFLSEHGKVDEVKGAVKRFATTQQPRIGDVPEASYRALYEALDRIADTLA